VNKVRLFRVPEPMEYEALSAWLSRLALSQGTAPSEVAKLLDLDFRRDDVDRSVTGERLQNVRRICGLAPSAFAVSERVMMSLSRLHRGGKEYLVKHKGPGNARFRFCPCCLTEMPVPHFPIHWRFIAWRRCPDHDCLLEDSCPHCDKPILFPINIEQSTSGRAGYASLDRCHHCANLLTNTIPYWLNEGDRRLVTPGDDGMLHNGRALLAALVNRSFQIQGRNGSLDLRGLAKIRRWQLFPVDSDWLSPKALRTQPPQTPMTHESA